MKTLINPTVKKNTKEVKPNVVPKICGMVFLIPKLKPEYDATILFGPGVYAATNQNNAIDNISGCIVYEIGRPFSDFWEGCNKITFPSLSIEPKIKTCETTPAIFFSGKLQIPITCFPFKFSSL